MTGVNLDVEITIDHALYSWKGCTCLEIHETSQPAVGYCCCEAVWLCSWRLGEKSVLQLFLALGTRSGTSRTGCALPNSTMQTLIDAIRSGNASRDSSQVLSHVNRSVRYGKVKVKVVIRDPKQSHMRVLVRTRVQRFSIWESGWWGVALGRPGLELGRLELTSTGRLWTCGATMVAFVRREGSCIWPALQENREPSKL